MRARGPLVIAALAGAVALPAAAFGASKGLAVPDWMHRMMGDAPPEMERMMDDPPPGMERMMESPGMRRMMENPPPGMERMMRAPGMERMMATIAPSGGTGAANRR